MFEDLFGDPEWSSFFLSKTLKMEHFGNKLINNEENMKNMMWSSIPGLCVE